MVKVEKVMTEDPEVAEEDPEVEEEDKLEEEVPEEIRSSLHRNLHF